jgi:hypothetical protein
MKSQKIITKFNLLVIASLLTLNCSCTLNKRQLPKDGETDPQGKVTISTPPPAPVPIPTPTPTKIAEPNSTSVVTQTQNSTENATNKSELTDVQIPLDKEEFNHPTVPLKRQGLYRGKPVATLKKNFTGLIDLSNLAYTDSSSDYIIPYIRIDNEEDEKELVKSQSK